MAEHTKTITIHGFPTGDLEYLRDQHARELEVLRQTGVLNKESSSDAAALRWCAKQFIAILRERQRDR